VEAFDEAHDSALACGRLDVEYRLIGADGILRWVRDRGRIRREDGRCFLDGAILDVTEIHAVRDALVAARAEADRLAHTDHLTGVANRRSLGPLMERTAGKPTGLLLLDLDHFKRINDVHGHAVGDAVLVAVAGRMQAAVRGSDAVVRMGGEEFLVILSGVAEEAQLLRAAEHLRDRIGTDPVRLAAQAIDVTVSIGCALSGAGDEDFEAHLRRADQALYVAKQAGRNCIRVERPQAAAMAA
jgi:diguanylate cyclase (GGDEF)-like protein